MALSENIGLLFRIRADASQAESEVKRIRNTVSRELKEVENASRATAGGMGGLGTQITSLINPTALLAGGALAAGTAIFGMGKQAIDAASQLVDLNAKTNINIETLSALQLAGEKVGVDINSLASSFAILQKNMIAAQDPTSKQGQLFRELNIDLNSNEQALRDAFRALSEMGEGAEQTDAALKLFGRSGTQVLAVLKEMKGDLDGAIDKFREAGSLISTETAKALDDVGDAFTEMGQRAKGNAAVMTQNLIPAIQVLMGTLNALLTLIGAVGKAFNILTMDILNRPDFGDEALRAMGIPGFKTAMQLNKYGAPSGAPSLARGLIPKRTTGIEAGRAILPGFTQTESAYTRREFDKTQDLYGGGARNLIPKVRGGGGGGEGRDLDLTAALRGFREAERERNQEFTRALKEFENERKEALRDAERLAKEHESTLTETAAIGQRARIAQLRDDAEEGKITYLQAEEAILAILKVSYDKQLEVAKAALVAEKEGTAEYFRLAELYGLAQAKAAEFKEEAERRKRDALRKTIELEDISTQKSNRELGTQADVPGASGAEILKDAEKTTDYSEKKQPKPDFSAWKESVTDVKEMTIGAFMSMGQAMGAVISQFVLYGNTGGQSIKKVMSQVLAAVAAEAGVKAIFQLAEGFAKLAGFMPGPAALHFKAAALYGAVALTAGVAGRALAGSSSQGQSEGGAGTSSGGSRAASSEPKLVEASRGTSEARGFTVNVKVTRDNGSIVEAWVEDWRKNGLARSVVQNDR